MGNAYKSITAVCPYYKNERPDEITCDGLCGALYIKQRFSNKIEARKHKARYCRLDWKNCPIAAMLERYNA